MKKALKLTGMSILLLGLIGPLNANENCNKDEKKKNFKDKLLEKFDEDGDGKLSKEEKRAAKKARHQHKMLKRFDKDRDGKLSEEEKEEAEKAKEEFIAKYDTDGDGKLSKEERKEPKKDHMRKRKEKRTSNEDSIDDFVPPPEE